MPHFTRSNAKVKGRRGKKGVEIIEGDWGGKELVMASSLIFKKRERKREVRLRHENFGEGGKRNRMQHRSLIRPSAEKRERGGKGKNVIHS